MRATAYHVHRVNVAPANTLTEIVNAKQAALDEAEILRNGNQPHWELESTTFIGDGELLQIWARWEF